MDRWGRGFSVHKTVVGPITTFFCIFAYRSQNVIFLSNGGSTVSLVTEYMSLVNLAGEMCGNTMILKVTTCFYLLIIHFYFFELTDSKFLFVQDNKH